jgi:hypothetical protein
MLAALLLFLNACAINQISNYDQKSMDQMELVAMKVDRFFVGLSYTPKSERKYQKYASNYLDIEVELNALKLRQQVRATNDLTLKQVEIAQMLWSEDRKSHQKKDTISDFIIKRHRQQFNRVFLAMIKGEESKPTTKS